MEQLNTARRLSASSCTSPSLRLAMLYAMPSALALKGICSAHLQEGRDECGAQCACMHAQRVALKGTCSAPLQAGRANCGTKYACMHAQRAGTEGDLQRAPACQTQMTAFTRHACHPHGAGAEGHLQRAPACQAYRGVYGALLACMHACPARWR
jgi:hypothetical protein